MVLMNSWLQGNKKKGIKMQCKRRALNNRHGDNCGHVEFLDIVESRSQILSSIAVVL